MSSRAVYLIPGIGADHRVFEATNLPEFETHIIRWVHPEKDEPIAEYVKRLLPQINHASPIFVGLSFGGLIGAELTKLFPESKLILISSIASRKELPWWARLGGTLKLNRLFPGKLMKRPSSVVFWIFSVHRGHEENLFRAILQDSDPDFLVWALNEILNWKGSGTHRVHHIHGGIDRLLPCRFTSADLIIEDGGHFMIVSHGKKISEMLRNLLLLLS